MAPEVDLETVYQRTERVLTMTAEVRLRPCEWGILYAADGYRCIAELACDLRLSPAVAVGAAKHLSELGYLRETELSLEACARVTAAVRSLDPPQPLATFLARFRSPASATSSLKEPTELPPSDTKPSAKKSGAIATRSIPFEPLHMPSQNPGPRSLNLGALIRFITARFPDTTAGQLAVYRVFMGVSTGLLRREGIQTLRFDEDRIVKDPDLVSHLEKAVQKNLGVEIPKEAFASDT